MNNPLRIFSKDQLYLIDQRKLKIFKKEFLLEFQLSTNSTIIIKGEEIDKNGILDIFEELEKNLALYVFIHENIILNIFFSKGNTALFNDNSTIQNIKKQTEYKNEIEQKIVSQLQPMIADLVMKPNGSDQLKLIKIFIYKINPALIDKAYANAYEELKTHLCFLEEEYKNPFLDQYNTYFRSGLGKYIDVSFYQNLEQLPDLFNTFKRRYGLWCHNNIVCEAFIRERKFVNFSRESLLIIKDAAKIASNVHNEESNIMLVIDIQNYLKTAPKELSTLGKVIFWIVILILFFSIKFILSNAISLGKSKNEGKDIQEAINEVVRENILAIEEGKRDDMINIKSYKYNVLDLIGDKKEALHTLLTERKYGNNFSELTFNIDVHPSTFTYFNRLIPANLAYSHNGKLHAVVMNFTHRDIINSTLKHKLKFDFKSKRKNYPFDYHFKAKEIEGNLDLLIKKIDFENYPLHGVLSRCSSNNLQILHSTKFKIDYSRETNTFNIILKSSNKKITFSNDYLSKMDAKNEIEEVDKFAIAIKYINEVNNKKLEHGNIYTLNNVFGYTIKPSINKDYPSKSITSKDAYLKYYITSKEDNTSYVELNGDDVSLRYYVDFDSGRIKGLTMVASTDDKSEVERITLFSSK